MTKQSSDFEESFVDNTDPYTHHISDWQGTFILY